MESYVPLEHRDDPYGVGFGSFNVREMVEDFDDKFRPEAKVGSGPSRRRRSVEVAVPGRLRRKRRERIN
jgi:hypothetical protein